VAQYRGANRPEQIGLAVWQGVRIALWSIPLLLATCALAPWVFSLSGHDPAIAELEVTYYQVLTLGGGGVLLSVTFSSFFTGLGRTRVVMVVDAIGAALNIALDYAWIFGRWGFPEMGMQGAALATVLSGVLSFSVYGFMMASPAYSGFYSTLSGWRPDGALFSRLVKYGVPSGMQFMLDMAGFAAFVLIVGRLGTVSLAATNIAFNINTLAFMPMIGFGIAVSVLVGRYIGRGRPDLASRSTYSGFLMTMLYMSTVAFLYVAVPGIFTAPYAAGSGEALFPEIRRLTEVLLRFVALYSIFDTMNIIFASAIKGAGDTRFVMYIIVLMSGCVLVIPTWYLVMVMGLGIMAAWVVATTYVILLGFVFYLRFLQGKWKVMRVIEETPAIHPIPPSISECPDTKFEP